MLNVIIRNSVLNYFVIGFLHLNYFKRTHSKCAALHMVTAIIYSSGNASILDAVCMHADRQITWLKHSSWV